MSERVVYFPHIKHPSDLGHIPFGTNTNFVPYHNFISGSLPLTICNIKKLFWQNIKERESNKPNPNNSVVHSKILSPSIPWTAMFTIIHSIPLVLLQAFIGDSSHFMLITVGHSRGSIHSWQIYHRQKPTKLWDAPMSKITNFYTNTLIMGTLSSLQPA